MIKENPVHCALLISVRTGERMKEWQSRDGQLDSPLWHRLNRLLGEINLFLMAVAIGLSVLDLTCFAASYLGQDFASALLGAIARHPTQQTDIAPDFQ